MGFEGLGDLMRSRCLSQETHKPRWLFARARRCGAEMRRPPTSSLWNRKNVAAATACFAWRQHNLDKMTRAGGFRLSSTLNTGENAYEIFALTGCAPSS